MFLIIWHLKESTHLIPYSNDIRRNNQKYHIRTWDAFSCHKFVYKVKLLSCLFFWFIKFRILQFLNSLPFLSTHRPRYLVVLELILFVLTNYHIGKISIVKITFLQPLVCLTLILFCLLWTTIFLYSKSFLMLIQHIKARYKV